MILILLFQFCTESIIYMISELAEKDKAQSTDLASWKFKTYYGTVIYE